MMSIIVYYY